MRRIAFVIDYPEYAGGAHVATFALINKLRNDGYTADVISPDIPKSGVRKQVFRAIKHTHLGWYPNWVLDPDGKIRRNLSTYDSVCCLGEPSISRKLVSQLPRTIRKVLLVHIDYYSWVRIDKCAKEYCRFDKKWYPKYDCIGVIGVGNTLRMASCFPAIREKIMPFHNIIEIESANHIASVGEQVNIISIIRVGDFQKRTERYLEAASKLKQSSIKFQWRIYGGGPKLADFKRKTTQLGLSDSLDFCGQVEHIGQYLREADIMVLLSEYEGMPNVIYESLLCGTPVFSTNVGGISEQIIDGETGWLVLNEDKLIYKKLVEVVSNKETITSTHTYLSHYQYDNDKSYREMLKIIGD